MTFKKNTKNYLDMFWYMQLCTHMHAVNWHTTIILKKMLLCRVVYLQPKRH